MEETYLRGYQAGESGARWWRVGGVGGWAGRLEDMEVDYFGLP